MSTTTIEHQHVGGSAGGPGQNSAECACGTVFDGFDVHAEATRLLDQHIRDETRKAQKAAERAEYIGGLRMLADVLENNPHLRLPHEGRDALSCILVMPHEDQRRELADWARVLPGRKEKGESAGRYFTLVGTLRGLHIKVICDRPEVCERVVVGTREVTETVPDPTLVAAVPTIEVTKMVEDVKWVCKPVLDGDGSPGDPKPPAGAVESDPSRGESHGSLPHGAGHTDSAGTGLPADQGNAADVAPADSPTARVTPPDTASPTAVPGSPRRDPGTPDGGDGVGASTAGTAASLPRRSRTGGHPCIDVPPGVLVLGDPDSGDPRRS